MGFIEAISDNFLFTAGRPIEVLEQLAETYPVVLHGVALSIGATAPLDHEYVRALVRLRDRVHARWVSDHLCFTGTAGANTHDLLPLPLTRAALRHVSERIRRVQDALQAPLVIENPSTYLAWQADELPEWEFLAQLCRHTGCGLLLDVNNVYVSSRNHGFTCEQYLDGVPWDQVVQFHVAGHRDKGTHCIDTHDETVIEPVWQLLGEAWCRADGASILLERDADIPPFETLYAELQGARRVLPAHARIAGSQDAVSP